MGRDAQADEIRRADARYRQFSSIFCVTSSAKFGGCTMKVIFLSQHAELLALLASTPFNGQASKKIPAVQKVSGLRDEWFTFAVSWRQMSLASTVDLLASHISNCLEG